MKKYYLIYQITNNLNHKIYIGKHKTDNLDDNYFGSGQHLRNAQEKYGLENFTKTILFYCANEEEMNLLEKTVVTPEFCAREDVYNIKEGGNGGWNYVNLSGDYGAGTEKRQCAAKKIKEFYLVPENAIAHSKATSIGIQRSLNNMSSKEREIKKLQNSKKAIVTGFSQAFFGKHHSEKTRQQLSQIKQENPLIGEKNGMYGKHWYYDPVTLKCASFKDFDVPAGWIKGRIFSSYDGFKLGSKKTTQKNKGRIQIYNPTTKERRHIYPTDSIPTGFVKSGRPISEDERRRISNTIKTKSPNGSQNPKHIQERIEFLRPRYACYLKFGFDEMVKKFEYPYTLPNFLGACKKYLPEYAKRF